MKNRIMPHLFFVITSFFFVVKSMAADIPPVQAKRIIQYSVGKLSEVVPANRIATNYQPEKIAAASVIILLKKEAELQPAYAY